MEGHLLFNKAVTKRKENPHSRHSDGRNGKQKCKTGLLYNPVIGKDAFTK